MAPTFLHPFASPSRREFVDIVRGDGAVIWDSDGNEYLDAMASLWYCNVGHGRNEIADAVSEQLRTLAGYSCFDPFTNPPADALADRIAELTSIPDARVFFTQDGSGAVDTAMKLARLAQVLAGHPERTLIISRERGYHGVNYGGTSAQGIPPNRDGYGPLVGEVIQVGADDTEALSVTMREHAGEIAAVLTEPVQGAGGVHPPAGSYLADARRLCDEHGALLIFDEVITGFGRLGTWFADQHYEVTPDLSTFAKAVTSGYLPLGGVIVGPRTREALESDPNYVLRHGYTYSGHPAVCAAGLANLSILADEGLVVEATRIGRRLRVGLESLLADGAITAVRGIGGVWAVDVGAPHDGATVRDRMRDAGVITRAIGDTCTFCPPLVTSDAQLDRIVDVLATTLAAR